MRRRFLPVLPLALAPFVLVGCKPSPAALGSAWNQAVAHGNAGAAWALVGGLSRARILDGLRRAQARALTDPAVKGVFEKAFGPDAAHRPVEALALTTLTAQLPELAKRPAPTGLERQGLHWGLTLEPWGFQTGDGVPLTLGFGGPALDRTAGAESFRVRVDRNGKSVPEVEADYGRIFERVGQELNLGPGYSAQAKAVASYLDSQLIEPLHAYDLQLVVAPDGDLGAAYTRYNESLFHDEQVPVVTYTYRAWR